MDLQHLAAQLRKPEGEAGIKVGEIMNKGNRLVNDWAVKALALTAEDKVLEIGMGNGAFVKDIIEENTGLAYYGIDYSPTMVEEAITINQDLVKSCRATFVTGNVKELPFDTGYFSKIFTVNTIYFWEDAQQELVEINRVLQPAGVAVFAIRTKDTMAQMPFTDFGFIKYDLHELTTLLKTQFTILSAFQKKEPPYIFNDKPVVLENAIVVCGKK